LSDALGKYYSKLASLTEKEKSEKFAARYRGKYRDYTDRTLKEIIGIERLDSLSNSSSKKIADIILSGSSRDKMADAAAKMLASVVEGDKTVEELFNGKLKSTIEDNIPSIFEKLTRMVKKTIEDSKGAITINVQREIKNNLHFLEKSMYMLMDGDVLVDSLINKILAVKIPAFIDDKSGELYTIMAGFLRNNIYKAKAGRFIDSFNTKKIGEIIDEYVSKPEHIRYINDKSNEAVGFLRKNLEVQNLGSILEFANLESIEKIFESYGNELEVLLNTIGSSMAENRDEILSQAEALTNKAADELMSQKFSDIFKDLSEDDVQESVSSLVNILNKDGFISDSIIKLLDEYKIFTADKNLSEFIDMDGFRKSMENFTVFILESEKTDLFLKELYSSVLDRALSENLGFIHEDTKKYFVEKFSDSSIQSLRNNLNEILRAIEFDKMTQEEIKAMEPEKIHEMFNSFAGKYFTRLILYGFGGFVFGINMYIGLGLTALKIAGETVFKKKKDE
jgi:hypothetical protein